MDIFSGVYYDKSSGEVCDLDQEPKDLCIFYVTRAIRSSRRPVFDNLAYLSETSLSWGLSNYPAIAIDSIKEINIRFEIVEDYYKIFRATSFFPNLSYNNMDTTLLCDNSKLTNYIMLLRAFPFFNYLMLKKVGMKDEQVTEILSSYDVIENFGLTKKLYYNDNERYYLRNIRNILLGRLNFFSYYIKTDGSWYHEESYEKILQCQQYFLNQNDEHNLSFYDIPQNIFNEHQVQRQDYDPIFRWCIKKFLIKELESVLEQNSSDFIDGESIIHLKMRYQQIKSLVTEIERRYDLTLDYKIFGQSVRQFFDYMIELIRFVYVSKNRDDACLLLSLLFSTDRYKIMIHTNRTNNYLFNVLKYFEEHKNINIHVI